MPRRPAKVPESQLLAPGRRAALVDGIVAVPPEDASAFGVDAAAAPVEPRDPGNGSAIRTILGAVSAAEVVGSEPEPAAFAVADGAALAPKDPPPPEVLGDVQPLLLELPAEVGPEAMAWPEAEGTAPVADGPRY